MLICEGVSQSDFGGFGMEVENACGGKGLVLALGLQMQLFSTRRDVARWWVPRSGKIL